MDVSACTVNGLVYAIGGSPDQNNVLSVVEVYDPVKDTWTKGTDMPTPRGALSTSVVNRRIYAIGGYGQGFINVPIVEEYDTGFREKVISVKAKGKLTTTWGEIRRTK
jgi:N-acetylneuraminic acid mutarotase